MSKIKIFGHSDDLIEVEGEGLTDEFYGGESVSHVVLSTGDRFTVQWIDGVWTIEHAQNVGMCEVQIKRAPAGDDYDEDDYSDVARVSGPIVWVEHWDEWPPAKEQVLERIEQLDVPQPGWIELYRAAQSEAL